MKNELAPSSPTSLLDMSVPQLAEAFKLLDQTRENHDRASGICATLQGLVLIEAKRKLAHGKYTPWVKSNFPKSHDVANRYMRIAADFLEKAPKFKFRINAEFESAVAVLKKDLHHILCHIEQSKLDLKHPIVEAVAHYVQDQTSTQLWLNLGDGHRGGNQYDRYDDKGNLIKGKGAGTPEEKAAAIYKNAQEQYLELCHRLESYVLNRKDWIHLKHPEIETLHDLLLDCKRALDETVSKLRKRPLYITPKGLADSPE